MGSIIKEIIIILLLVVVIFLLLAIIFYEYMPISIAVPENVESYATPAEIQDETEQEVVQYSKQTDPFEISEKDMKEYRQTKSYDESKANPFLPYYTEYYGLDEDSGKKKVDTDVDLGYSTTNSKTNTNTAENTAETSNTAVEKESSKSSKVFDTKLK